VSGQRLPVPPRERKPALAALAVLLIVGGALVSAYLVMASGQRVSAVRIAQPVAAGQQIPASALEEAQIGNTGVEFIRWSERSKITNAYASVGLVPGTLLINEMMSKETDAVKGKVIIGLSLKPAQLPANGLAVGDKVVLYAVGTKSEGTTSPPGMILSPDASVYQAALPSSSSRASSISVNARISVAVMPAQAALVAQYASAGNVAVAIVPTGTVITVPQPTAPVKPGKGG
jgi:hypothetical protein